MALLLKTVDVQMRAHGGFVWPRSGEVVAPDWNPAPVCGGGLHGLPWGEGDGNLLWWDAGAIWLVAEYDEATAVAFDGKVKVPRCVVVHVGTQETATRYLQEHGGAGRAIVGAPPPLEVGAPLKRWAK